MPVTSDICSPTSNNCEDTSDIPIIDVQEYINNGNRAKEQCEMVAESLHKYGILIVKDVVSGF